MIVHNRCVPLLIIALVLFVSCRASPSKPQKAPADEPISNVIVSELAHTNDSDVDTEKAYDFTLRGERYELDRTGRFTCGGTKGSFQLDFKEMPYVDELQFLPYGTDILILLYELSDGEGGLSRISRVYLPTCEPVFTTDLPGFNLGQAALEGSTLYVSAIGFVGRFDVEAWGYDWTHGNLYERYKLNAFGKPVVFRDRVVFPETTYSSGSVPRNVVIQKSSGAIAISAQQPQAAGS